MNFSDDNLTPYQRQLIEQLKSAFQKQVEKNIELDSDIVTLAFENAFRTRLLFHHVWNDEPMTKKSFEYAFRDALRADGKSAELNSSNTARGYALICEGTKYSLKTEAHSAISERTIHISTLMEARWIRDCHKSREYLLNMIHVHVLGHFANYDRIVTLRVFRKTSDKGLASVNYQMVEIPKSVVLHIGNLTATDFAEIGELNQTSARVYINGTLAFTLSIDGSDEKITIRSLDMRFCKLHAKWTIPIERYA